MSTTSATARAIKTDALRLQQLLAEDDLAENVSFRYLKLSTSTRVRDPVDAWQLEFIYRGYKCQVLVHPWLAVKIAHTIKLWNDDEQGYCVEYTAGSPIGVMSYLKRFNEPGPA